MTCCVDPYLACSFCIHKCLLNHSETTLLCQWLMYVAALPSEKAHANLGMLKCSLSASAASHAGANLTP